MAIRDKIRKTFKTKSSSSSESSPNSSSNQIHYTGRTDIEYYKPHEIPKSKYRGRVDKAHQDSLEAYSFSDAFTTLRRKSSQALSGIVSPGGTKAQSRRTSYVSRRTRSSVSSAAGSERDGMSALSRKVTPAVRPPSAGVPRVDEGSDEDTDSKENSLSKGDTLTPKPELDHSGIPEVRLDRTATVTQGEQVASDEPAKSSVEQPFTAVELEQAMTRATVRGSGEAILPRASIPVH